MNEKYEKLEKRVEKLEKVAIIGTIMALLFYTIFPDSIGEVVIFIWGILILGVILIMLHYMDKISDIS